MAAELHIGTSGYSFQDWVGPFYPFNWPKNKMLDYYQDRFDTVEINSTYYHIPHPAVMEKIEAKTPPQFQFMVKIPQQFSHELKLEHKSVDAFLQAVHPLTNNGKLKGYLAQFPYRFKYSEKNIKYINDLHRSLDNIPLFIEFRHVSWYHKQTLEFLKNDQLGYVIVDAPKLKGLFPYHAHQTTDISYFRLHGRNQANWWDSGGGDRYDYLYSENELKSFIPDLKYQIEQSSAVYVFFNNCHAGQAVANAELLRQLLNLEF